MGPRLRSAVTRSPGRAFRSPSPDRAGGIAAGEEARRRRGERRGRARSGAGSRGVRFAEAGVLQERAGGGRAPGAPGRAGGRDSARRHSAVTPARKMASPPASFALQLGAAAGVVGVVPRVEEGVRVRHQAEDPAGRVGDAGHAAAPSRSGSPARPRSALPAASIQRKASWPRWSSRAEHLGRLDHELPLAVPGRDVERRHAAGPDRPGLRVDADADPGVAVAEPVVVGERGARHEVGRPRLGAGEQAEPGQRLEAVADAEHAAAAGRGRPRGRPAGGRGCGSPAPGRRRRGRRRRSRPPSPAPGSRRCGAGRGARRGR